MDALALAVHAHLPTEHVCWEGCRSGLRMRGRFACVVLLAHPLTARNGGVMSAGGHAVSGQANLPLFHSQHQHDHSQMAARNDGGAMVAGGPHANGRAASPPSQLAVRNGESNIAAVKRARALAGLARCGERRDGAVRRGWGGRHASGDGAGCSKISRHAYNHIINGMYITII